MRRWWWTLPVLAVLALATYVVAGPYLAIRGISEAIAEQDTARLERHVDFPRLRVNIKAQLDDYLVRHAGMRAQSSLLGGLALQLAGTVTGVGVDTFVTPTGIGALMQGRTLWKRASGDTVGGDTWARTTPDRPLQRAEHDYQSPSQFTATVHTADGRAIVFVLNREGLRWKLTNILLPLAPPDS